MKSLKRILRLFAFILLIILACIGIAISGGIPLIPICKKKYYFEAKIELVEPQNDKKPEFDEFEKGKTILTKK